MADRPLRIAMIGLRGLPATWGGVERHVEELSARLVGRGHTVTAFCRSGYSDQASTQHRGIDLRVLPAPRVRGVEALTHSFASAALSLAQDYDVVHFHAIGPGIAAVLPRWLSRARVVQTVHGLDADRAKWRGPERLVLGLGMQVSRRVPHATVTVSRELQRHYWEQYGRASTYVANGSPAPVRASAQHLRDRFGLEPGSYLLFVGRLVPEKAPDVLLEAFAAVPGALRLVVAGGCSDTEAYTRELTELAARDERVLMPGYVYGDDLAALYSHARAFVLPSLLEGMPLTLLEAISYGLPVVVSSIPPHVEVVGVDAPGTRIARPGDVLDLRDALLRSLADEELERRGAALQHCDIRARYDWDHAADLLEQVYLDVVTAPVARTRWSTRVAGRDTIELPAQRLPKAVDVDVLVPSAGPALVQLDDLVVRLDEQAAPVDGQAVLPAAPLDGTGHTGAHTAVLAAGLPEAP